MFKVIYEEKVHTVYDVKSEFEWGYFGYDERRKFPTNTWFLINTDYGFDWVRKSECMPVEE